MPFTFSHPAIILPLEKTKLCLTGLVAGSLTPDFEYFLRMHMKSEFSHTYLGGIYFGLPMGLLLCFLFHQLIKVKLIQNLPSFLQLKLWSIKRFNWIEHFKQKWSIVIVSILIGTYSHILWDSFTHQDAFFVNLFNLNSQFADTNYPVFKLFQHGSTIVGGLFILLYVGTLEKTNTLTTKPTLKYWSIFLFLTFVILTIRIVAGLSIKEYGNIIVSGISASMISIILVSLLEFKEN